MLHQDVSSLLREELRSRQAKKPSYSTRALARDLSLSPAAVSQIISAKRKATQKTILKISQRLGLSLFQTLQLTRGAIQREIKTTDPTSDESFHIIPDDQFALISDWQHFAILVLCEVPESRAEAEWFAERLNIPTDTAQQCFERLQRMGLVRVDENNRPVPLGPVRLPHETPREANRKHHRETLELAKKKIDEVDIQLRDFSSITMAIDLKKIPVAKQMIQDFRRTLCAELESGDKQEVYTLAVQLFPLTQSRTPEKSL